MQARRDGHPFKSSDESEQARLRPPSLGPPHARAHMVRYEKKASRKLITSEIRATPPPRFRGLRNRNPTRTVPSDDSGARAARAAVDSEKLQRHNCMAGGHGRRWPCLKLCCSAS